MGGVWEEWVGGVGGRVWEEWVGGLWEEWVGGRVWEGLVGVGGCGRVEYERDVEGSGVGGVGKWDGLGGCGQGLPSASSAGS